MFQGTKSVEFKRPAVLPQRDASGYSTDDDVKSRNNNSNSSQICLDFFRQSMSPEQFDQLVAVSNDEDNPSVLFSIHPTTFQRFVDAVNAYPVQPPLGLVFAVPVSKEALMVAILDYLRGAGTLNPSSATIGQDRIDLFAMHSAGIFTRDVSNHCIGVVRLVCSFEGFCTWNHNWAH